MRSYDHINRDTHQDRVQPFAARAKAADPMAHIKMATIFILAVVTVLIAGIISMNAGNASQAQEIGTPAPQGMMATKSDRIASSSKMNTCDGQAWGAWSADCAASLTGAKKVRNVSFVTVEKKAPTVNETILARYPVTK